MCRIDIETSPESQCVIYIKYSMGLTNCKRCAINIRGHGILINLISPFLCRMLITNVIRVVASGQIPPLYDWLIAHRSYVNKNRAS